MPVPIHQRDNVDDDTSPGVAERGTAYVHFLRTCGCCCCCVYKLRPRHPPRYQVPVSLRDTLQRKRMVLLQLRPIGLPTGEVARHANDVRGMDEQKQIILPPTSLKAATTSTHNASNAALFHPISDFSALHVDDRLPACLDGFCLSVHLCRSTTTCFCVPPLHQFVL